MSRACTEEEKRKRKITVESTTIIPIKPNQRRILCYCCDEEKSYGHVSNQISKKKKMVQIFKKLKFIERNIRMYTL